MFQELLVSEADLTQTPNPFSEPVRLAKGFELGPANKKMGTQRPPSFWQASLRSPSILRISVELISSRELI